MESAPSVCVFNDFYIDRGDAWGSWAIFTVLFSLSYFTLFWFGADAVRVLRPDTGYDLYYLWPNWLYQIIVAYGIQPDGYN